MERGLELLTFEDVTSDKDAAASKVGDTIGTLVFTTADGLAVHVTVLKGEKDIWARFSAEARDASGTTQAGTAQAGTAQAVLPKLSLPSPASPKPTTPNPATTRRRKRQRN